MNTFNAPNSVNHNGWVVEELVEGKGWVVVFGPEPDRDFASAYKTFIKGAMRHKEFRVYEALK